MLGETVLHQIKWLLVIIAVFVIVATISPFQQSLRIEQYGWCLVQCDGHGYAEKVIYNHLTGTAQCQCQDGVELEGKPPAEELQDEYGPGH